MKYLIGILILCLLLGGCTQELTEYTLDTAPTAEMSEQSISTTVDTKPDREYTTYPVERPADHVVGNDYYYTDAKIISYYDPEIQRKVVLCSQPNCTHSSKECTAYLGGAGETRYLVVGDMAYVLVDDSGDSGKIHFVAQNIVTGERNVLWDLTPEKEETERGYFNLSIDGNTAFLSFRQHDIQWKEDGGYSEQNIADYAYAIDLKSGKQELLLKSDIPSHDSISLSGDSIVAKVCTESYLLIYDVDEFKEVPMSEEEYWKENPNGDYLAYLDEYQWPEGAYYSVNRKTGERKRLFGGLGEAKIQDSVGPFREKKLSFADGDTICIYDGETGQVTRCFTRENIAMQSYKDGRIIYNVVKSDGSYEYFWYDVSTGEEQQFQVGTSIMIFSLMEETADYFVGYYNGRTCFISKQDWYNENYDAAF